MAIFRSFTELNMRCLLYQQAELLDLEADLERIALADKSSGDSQKESYERSWWALSKSAHDGCDLQFKRTKEIQEKLRVFSTFPDC